MDEYIDELLAHHEIEQDWVASLDESLGSDYEDAEEM